jgi:hypothetical protein
MSANTDEYKKIQRVILKFLFDSATLATLDEICSLTKKPKSEAEYHCDELRVAGLIGNAQKISGGALVRGFIITAKGRKEIMEQ